ncbi:jerky protein homolog-like [Ptychodera flava]|uniref:jerky protein homolog-like n=1 Tax=Ptychodera flava TaxID=63121 RepID=UPI003969C876
MATSSVKRKRNMLDLDTKLSIIDRLERGESATKLSREFGVGKSTITDIKNSKAKLHDFASRMDTNVGVKRKIMKTAIDEALQKSVLTWFTQERRRGTLLAGQIITEKAKWFDEQLHGEQSQFKASTGWLKNFQQRHGIRQISVQGEKLSSNESKVEPFIRKLHEIIEKESYTPEQLYNADESGLYWKLLPRKTLAASSEKSAPGFKVSKDRVTVMGCANASGTHKLPPVIIGKSRNPRCFKHVNMDNLPVRYLHQANAWMSAELFSTWFRDDFVPSVRHHLRQKQLPEKALLLIDNAPSHPSTDVLQSNDGLITCMFLPPNTTPLLQPMDQGVLNALKRRYKGKMLRKIVKENSNNISLTECVKTVTLKDTCYMIAESWRELTVDTLANAWHKLRINIADTPETASTPEVTNPASDKTIEEVINALPADDRVQASEWFDVDESDPGCQTLADEEIIQAAQKSQRTSMHRKTRTMTRKHRTQRTHTYQRRSS